MMLRPDRFCNLVYSYIIDRVEDRKQFEEWLIEPLPGRAKKATPEQLKAEANAFLAFQGEMMGA